VSEVAPDYDEIDRLEIERLIVDDLGCGSPQDARHQLGRIIQKLAAVTAERDELLQQNQRSIEKARENAILAGDLLSENRKLTNQLATVTAGRNELLRRIDRAIVHLDREDAFAERKARKALTETIHGTGEMEELCK